MTPVRFSHAALRRAVDPEAATSKGDSCPIRRRKPLRLEPAQLLGRLLINDSSRLFGTFDSAMTLSPEGGRLSGLRREAKQM
mmetsp:Transcript_550/g.969  ORF Transcript_550/g.969 Transcript_550/m.969 type:complete len:82 (+) Transcript_550:415-660(+)